MTPGFRDATAEDAGELAQLVNAAYRPAGPARGWTHESALVTGPRTSPEQVAALLRPGSVVLVACAPERILGCVHIEQRSGHREASGRQNGAVCFIGMLATDPDCQGSGLGKALLAQAEAVAAERFGAGQLAMGVLSSRPELLAFYERRGYRLSGAPRPYPVDAGIGTPMAAGLQVLTLAKALAQAPVQAPSQQPAIAPS